MGGKNHQPCKHYLLNSTRLSRHLSLAYGHLEFGNAALEDILIIELSPDRDPQGAVESYQAIRRELAVSGTELGHAKLALAALRQQMDETGFADLPTLGKIDLSQIGQSLAESGMVNLAAWKQVHELMKAGGFYAMVARFDADIDELGALNRALQAKFAQLESPVTAGILTDIVEENRPESFKPEFAALYAKWTEMNGLFLASSLMSTELWYAFTSKGTLAPTAMQLRAA
ncbi:MAG: hypothetical protein E6Q06_02720 [Candidatus Moraniibacteriota bacterium]|nr:MAG: hypothetical protein E6Q06_02720 [Candidatus Moranbacteria bacterium]